MSMGHFKLYTASAGSGKTYTLVKEFLILSLSSDNVSCKDILAVTFTNKSANEMKERILFELEGIIYDTAKDDNMKKDIVKALRIDEATLKRRAGLLYDDILHNYSDFNVSTIDGFVQQLSRSFSKELNLPAQYRVLLDDDDLLDGLIQCIDSHINKDDKSITEMLSDFLNFQLDEENSSRIDSLLREFITKLLKESAYKKGEMLNVKELSDDEYRKIKASLSKKYNTYKNNIIEGIKQIRDFEEQYDLTTADYNNGSKGLPSILTKIENDISVAPSSVVGKTISDILFFEDKKDWFSKKIKKEKAYEVNQNVDVKELYKTLLENHKNLFLVDLVRKNLYLYALRGKLLAIINQHIDETNKVHISEFNKRISDILGDCSIPFIYERISARYRHFFIDEFQDTSLLQWHNFLPLVNNGLSEDNMSMIVGDAKQAIYRFRSGEVEQIINLPEIYKAEDNEFYRECQKTFKNRIKKESLSSNYRSKKNIIDFNNSFFKLSKYKLSDNYRKVYQDNMRQECGRKYPYDGFVSVEIFDMKKFSDNDSEESANKLYKDSVKQSIYDDILRLTNDKERCINYKDIAILVRSNSDGSDIAEFLSKKNIPVISSESFLLKSSDKVRLIILTLKYLSDDKNDVTKLSHSFYKNVCADNDSYDLAKALQQLDSDKELIYEIRNKSYSIYDLCCGIMRLYNFNVLEDVFLQYFMNFVLEWQNNENAGIDAFVEYWDKKSDGLYVKISSGIDAVQITTIHKSKGLEFKVVMYPYAYTKVPNGFRGNEKWLPSHEFELLKDIDNIDSYILPISKNLLGTDMECHYTEEIEKAAFDDFNIMYVAMTRPKDMMFIYTNNKGAATEEKKDDDSYNFFVEYFDANNGYFTTNEKGEVIDVAEKEDVDFIENRFKISKNEVSVTYTLGEIPYFEYSDDDDKIEIIELTDDNISKPLEWTKVLTIEPDPTMFWAEDKKDYLPQEWGNLVHNILAKINTIEDSRRVLQTYVNEGSIDEQQAEELYSQFEKIVNIKEIKDAYSKEAVIRNEMDILIADKNNKNNENDKNDKNNKNKTVRPDRFAELEDKVILIDYKTAKPDREHHEQLKNYMQTLKDIGITKDIEAYIVYIRKKLEIEPVFLDRLF